MILILEYSKSWLYMEGTFRGGVRMEGTFIRGPKRCGNALFQPSRNPPVTLPWNEKWSFRVLLYSLLSFNIRKSVLTKRIGTGGWEGWEDWKPPRKIKTKEQTKPNCRPFFSSWEFPRLKDFQSRPSVVSELPWRGRNPNMKKRAYNWVWSAL